MIYWLSCRAIQSPYATVSIITASKIIHKLIPIKETFQQFKFFPPIARNVQLRLQ